MSAFEPDFAGARVRASPNFGERREYAKPDTIILHYTGMESANAAEDWLCDPASEVSSHYLVHEDGSVVQMVPEAERAWHAGAGSWRGRGDVNSFSVGIEIVNPGHSLGYRDFPEPQIEAVIKLCRDICARHGIAPERVLAHSDVAPGRKVDPGEKFPWKRLAEAGVGLHVEPADDGGAPALRLGDEGAEVLHLKGLLAAVGYGIEPSPIYDQRTRTVVEAFQRRFRPALIDGIADAQTRATLAALLQRQGDVASTAQPTA